MLHGILVATELSDRSADPPARAAMLAAAHARDKPDHLSVAAPGWTGLAEQAMARIEATAPGLVVLGWHAPTWLGRLRNAWTFRTLARRSPRPVLVVRQPPLRPYARVLVAVDFSEEGSAAAIASVRTAVRCAPGARFTLLHAFDTALEGFMRRAGVASHVIGGHRRKLRSGARAAFRRLLRSLGLPETRFSLVTSPHPERAALRLHAASARPDLVVVGRRRGGWLDGWFGAWGAREALAATSCDLLLVPPRERRMAARPAPGAN